MPSHWQTLSEQASPSVTQTDRPSIVHLSQWSVLEFKGPQAAKFLQGQVTLNVEALAPGQAAYGGYCNLKGRLHALFYIGRLPDEDDTFWLILPKDNLEHAFTTLKKYALFSKVTITPIMDWPCIGLIEPSSLPQPFSTGAPFTLNSHSYQSLPFLSLHLNRRSIIFGQEDVLMALWQAVNPLVAVAQESAWDRLDIEEGRAFVHQQTLESFLPHYVGVVELGGVDFTKGCYLGQEIIARMEYKGTIKRHLAKAQVKAKELPEPGCKIVTQTNKKEVGQVVLAVPHQEIIHLLITVQDDAIQDELELTCGLNPSLEGLTPIKGPLVQPD